MKNKSRFIQGACILVTVIVWVVLFLGWLLLKRWYAMIKTDIIASRFTPTIVIAIIPFILDLLILYVLQKRLTESIENTDKDYCSIKHIKKKKKKNSHYITKKRKPSKEYVISIIIGIVFVIFVNLILIWPTFFPRIALTTNGAIIKYNSVNNAEEILNMSQYQSCEAEIVYHRTTVQTVEKYSFILIIRGDNRRFDFEMGDFRNIDTMLWFISSMDPELLSCGGYENLDPFIESTDLTPTQIADIQALFITQPKRAGDGCAPVRRLK